MLDDEALQNSPFESVTGLMDLEKAYEYVSLNLLRIMAWVQNAPLSVIALALESYSADRTVKKEQAMSNLVATLQGLPAGSKYANRMLKMLLHPFPDID